jgi:hypothetical protein
MDDEVIDLTASGEGRSLKRIESLRPAAADGLRGLIMAEDAGFDSIMTEDLTPSENPLPIPAIMEVADETDKSLKGIREDEARFAC